MEESTEEVIGRMGPEVEEEESVEELVARANALIAKYQDIGVGIPSENEALTGDQQFDYSENRKRALPKEKQSLASVSPTLSDQPLVDHFRIKIIKPPSQSLADYCRIKDLEFPLPPTSHNEHEPIVISEGKCKIP